MLQPPQQQQQQHNSSSTANPSARRFAWERQVHSQQGRRNAAACEDNIVRVMTVKCRDVALAFSGRSSGSSTTAAGGPVIWMAAHEVPIVKVPGSPISTDARTSLALLHWEPVLACVGDDRVFRTWSITSQHDSARGTETASSSSQQSACRDELLGLLQGPCPRRVRDDLVWEPLSSARGG